MYINSVELNHSKSINPKIIEPALANFLSNNGFIVSKEVQSSDYYITIKSNTIKGSIVNGICTSFLDIEISLLNNKNKNIIFSSSKSRLKGLKLNFESAGIDAYNRNIKLIEDELFNEIITNLINS